MTVTAEPGSPASRQPSSATAPDPGTGVPTSGSAAGPAARRATFRPDVDSLRAVAIVLVVAYHAHVHAFEGGFVGVDVFFVISGFLITRNLLDEQHRSGRVALWEFWARRLRRLVPAMAVMVCVTLLVGVLVLSPVSWPDLWQQGVGATVYASNQLFIRQSQDYFAAGVDQSPFLHTWSLAVEEQFYVVWPVLVAVLLVAGRRLARWGTVPLAVGLTVLGAASLAWGAGQVESHPAVAFYTLPSRAWEFAAAGLLAIAATRLRFRMPDPAAIALAVAGLAVIAWSALTYDATTRFPGLGAVPPVAGTLAVIAAGTWSQATWRAASAPTQWLGRLSYSWYLWHWPVMILVVAQLGRDTVVIRLLASGAALLIAMASLRFVEDPVRRHPRLVRSTGATVAVAAAMSVVVLVAAVGVRQWSQRPFAAELIAASSKHYETACDWSTTEAGDRVCTIGDPDGDRTVVLAGDSHAMSWIAGFDGAGDELGLRILVRVKSACPGAPVPTISNATQRLATDCLDFRAGTRRVIDAERPDLVVLGSADYTRRVADADGRLMTDHEAQLAAWATSLRDLQAELAADDIELGLILDNPILEPDPLICTGEKGSPARCGASRERALEQVQAHIDNERSVVGPEASFDTVDLVCTDTTCPVKVDGRYAYADPDHLSKGFTAAHAPEVAAFLRRFPSIAGAG